MSRISSSESASTWVSVVTKLPQETTTFTLNAMVDTLPHNANLYLWKKLTDICLLCSKGRQTLLHGLNNCSRALDLCWYNERHDAVLSIISESVREHLPIPSSREQCSMISVNLLKQAQHEFICVLLSWYPMGHYCYTIKSD